jgi:hypothetical protein
MIILQMTKMLPRLANKRNAMATIMKEIENEVIRLKEDYRSYLSSEEPAMTQQQQRLTDGHLTGPLFEQGLVVGKGGR